MIIEENNSLKNKRKKARELCFKHYNPNAVGVKGQGIFGFPFDATNAECVILPVPVDITTSYTAGTSQAPKQILEASTQLDFYNEYYKNIWQDGIAMLPIDKAILTLNKNIRKDAEKHIEALENSENINEKRLQKINKASVKINTWVKDEALKILNKQQKLVLLGGDHSSPLGMYQALSNFYSDFGILHIDAHFDLRQAYEGFEYSHASIMYNTLKEVKSISKLVSVGIRDYCEDEFLFAKQNKKVEFFTDTYLHHSIAEGHTWKRICQKIISKLPDNVHISFDIDGLKPYMCPNTGTPVIGGLEWEQITYLLELLHKSKKKIIGADLVEVSNGKQNNEFNANVGARVLFMLCNMVLKK